MCHPVWCHTIILIMTLHKLCNQERNFFSSAFFHFMIAGWKQSSCSLNSNWEMHSPVRRKMHGRLAFRVTSWVCALHLHRGLNFDNSDLVKSSILLNAVCLHEPNCTYSKRQDQVGRRRTKDLAVHLKDLHFFKRIISYSKVLKEE